MKYDLKVIVLNGYPRSGKDTFVKIAKTKYNCINHSTVDKVKEIATIMGWDGTKTSENRQMLSELKDFYTKWFNGSFVDIVNLIKLEKTKISNKIIFIHVREPEEIQKIKIFCKNEENVTFSSIFVVRNKSEKNHVSHSDQLVIGFNYDFYISNNSTLEEYKYSVLKMLSNM